MTQIQKAESRRVGPDEAAGGKRCGLLANRCTAAAGRRGYVPTMNLNLHPGVRLSRYQRWFLGVAWVVIAVKCLVVWWAIPHYHVPIHPLWIIGPTLVFAGFVTVLWTTHRE